MLREWDLNDLFHCWELYIEGTKLLETTEDIDLLPGDDALTLACYTLVKAYNATSTTPSLPSSIFSNLRTNQIPPPSGSQSRSRSQEK